ncbi:hypothetical protein [Jeotgalibacillus terrae]|uniref:Uncharacterized protein n=1 Tax=Jeotgalibacillus terrae TaxID=587735 RepID=A0ABW5ZF65_9BACL|nr:hypothetical protein [Jeotgalibacillus terrae]MBM7579996.1 hypothetical protein [Jeotgalibacillus terrae]
MAKKTWINISGTWTEVKNVWQNVGGVWKEKVLPKGNISGVWKEFMQYLVQIYKEGTEFTPLVEGINVSTNKEVERNAGYIRLYCVNSDASGTGINGGGQLALVTDQPLDLTNFSTVIIDWGTTLTAGKSHLIVSSVKNGDFNTFEAKRTRDGSFNRVVESLDVSGLTGEFYIRFHIQSTYRTGYMSYLYELRVE